ncbi:hypothetical protein IB642_03980 [Allofrancisella guangzhouensis]|nr:hypothetical protein [Allofrancisella guangzhouensis]MBK2027871.1 hypothetical protein [Allofrancisella guangzhouensis]MBK2044178.1 hypothetical protein [Allofrancisella guangzhouensis]
MLEHYDKDSYRTKAYLSIYGIKELFRLIYPITPDLSTKILDSLGLSIFKESNNILGVIFISEIKLDLLALYIKEIKNEQ